MPIVQVNRPRRSRIRHFSERDVIRIACTAIDHGANSKVIAIGLMRSCLKDDICDKQRVRDLVETAQGRAELAFRLLEGTVAVVVVVAIAATRVIRKILRIARPIVKKIIPITLRRRLDNFAQKEYEAAVKRLQDFEVEYQVLRTDIKKVLEEVL